MAMAKNPSTAAEAATDSDKRRAPERVLLTKERLDAKLRVRPHRQSMIWDTQTRGLSVLVSRGPKDKKQATLTFRVAYYLKSNPGKPRYLKLGRYDPARTDLDDIRRKAQRVRIDAEEGNDPKRPKLSGNFADTVALFLDEYAEGKRYHHETKRIFDRYVTSEWADKNIEDIEKADVTDLLSKIARGRIDIDDKKCGTPAVAKSTRTQLVTLFKWWGEYKTRNKDFRNPVPELLKSDPLQQATRKRQEFLGDDELRALWIACADMGAYGAAVKLGLLTAQRFRKVGAMRRADLKNHFRVQGQDGNVDLGNVWDATRADDPKNKRVSVVPLSDLARSILAGVPMIDVDDGEDFVFTTTGRGPLKGWSKYKARLDRKMLALLRKEAEAEGRDPDEIGEWVREDDRSKQCKPWQRVKPWQHRDLRRTARTLMARLKISTDVAEHCLAHVLPGIQQVYNRYDYAVEKREAFERLAELIERIVSPPANVVALAPKAGKRKAAGKVRHPAA
jgi:hypothetical protein